MVDVISLSGAKVKDVSRRLHATDLSIYKEIILYIGGNDVNNGNPLQEIMDELKKLTSYLIQQGCFVHLSTVAPRKDADVHPLNEAIKYQSRQFSIDEVDHLSLHTSFVFGDGRVVEQHYHRDGIHLNRKGTSLLVRRINAYVPVIKTQLLGTSQGNYQNQKQQPSPLYPRRHGINQNIRQFNGYKNHDANGRARPGNGNPWIPEVT